MRSRSKSRTAITQLPGTGAGARSLEHRQDVGQRRLNGDAVTRSQDETSAGTALANSVPNLLADRVWFAQNQVVIAHSAPQAHIAAEIAFQPGYIFYRLDGLVDIYSGIDHQREDGPEIATGMTNVEQTVLMGCVADALQPRRKDSLERRRRHERSCVAPVILTAEDRVEAESLEERHPTGRMLRPLEPLRGELIRIFIGQPKQVTLYPQGGEYRQVSAAHAREHEVRLAHLRHQVLDELKLRRVVVAVTARAFRLVAPLTGLEQHQVPRGYGVPEDVAVLIAPRLIIHLLRYFVLKSSRPDQIATYHVEIEAANKLDRVTLHRRNDLIALPGPERVCQHGFASQIRRPPQDQLGRLVINDPLGHRHDVRLSVLDGGSHTLFPGHGCSAEIAGGGAIIPRSEEDGNRGSNGATRSGSSRLFPERQYSIALRRRSRSFVLFSPGGRRCDIDPKEE